MYQSPDAHGPAPEAQCRLGALQRWGTLRLEASPAVAGQAGRDAAVLLAAAANVNRGVLLGFPERACTAAERDRYALWIGRRAAGEPVAYILGRREFWSLELLVTPDVLVPRPETELLVERSLELAGAGRLEVLELGTGSGAIALALARERPAWRITATDVSPAALAVARSNATRLALAGIEFRLGDWFRFDTAAQRGSPQGAEHGRAAASRFGLIVSNPPYVAGNDAVLADPVLRHEPRLALTPGPDGLAALRAIVAGAPERLEPGGWLVLEHGADQAAGVAAMLVGRGFRHVGSRRDLAGHERVSEAQWPDR